MSSEPARSAGPYVPDAPSPRNARAIADLVRRIIHARRGVSRAAVVEWVSQFMDGADQGEIAARIGSIIDVLCEMKDIGHGNMRDEPVLVALPERRVALPDGTVVALGDHGVFDVAGGDHLFPEVTGGTTSSLVETLTALHGPAAPGAHSAIEPAGRWASDDPMPAALRSSLLLSGTFDLAGRSWSVSPQNAAFLNDWFSLTPPDAFPDNAETPDESQLRVAQAPAGSRMVVEAGPGSGKTYVACERVIVLVRDEERAPARILLLSFTRIAVAELRSRIARGLPGIPQVAAVQIRTFDSFAASLLVDSGAELQGGHDAGIRAATRLLRSDNPLVADAIGQLEHVIIDEAQDLVGDRKDMCEALLDLLHPSCGITVFGDFAQSIYGYQRTGDAGSTLLTQVATRAGFTGEQLARDHRTRSDSLRAMFSSVRQTLRDDQASSRDGYFLVRDQIMTAAVENDIARFAVHPSTTRGLILTRSRRALFTAADEMRAAGRRFRLRLPDRPSRIEPWIGATLGGLPASTRLTRDDFRAAHETLSPAALRSTEECWDVLLDLDASSRKDISVGNVAEGLEETPLELLSDHEGSSGPLLSTIHAIKGKEEGRVMLLLSRAPYGDAVDWAEEARTLYVGATRACAELRTGWINPKTFYKIGEPERHWAARNDHRLIEIGLEGDLADWAVFVRSGHVPSETDTISNIWGASINEPNVAAYPDSAGRMIIRIGGSEGTVIGRLSDGFVTLMQSLRQVEPEEALPEIVSGISIVGATTVVVPGGPGDASRIALMPLLGGLASIPR